VKGENVVSKKRRGVRDKNCENSMKKGEMLEIKRNLR